MFNQSLIKRDLLIFLEKTSKNILLLGPRQVGKSTLANQLNPELIVNLMRETVYLDFARNPAELEQRLASISQGTVVIDEIQRLPSLLNTIQTLIDEKKNRYRFILTGSSARKLKRGQANLLPGRIHAYHLGPLTCHELDYNLNINKVLAFGTLPGVIMEASDQDKMMTLRTYAATYLKEEIQAEALTKNIEGFSRFIYAAANTATQFLDFSKLSSEASIPRQSAIRYFEILEDTLIVNRCESFSKNHRKRLIQHPRFFLFDVGVLNGLLDNFIVSQDRIGKLLEHFIFNQLKETAASQNTNLRISSYRTQHGAEVDFVLETKNGIIAIEVKASKNISVHDLRGLKNFQEYVGSNCRLILLYLGENKKTIEGVEVFPLLEFFKEFYARSLIDDMPPSPSL